MRIVILVYEDGALNDSGYFLHEIAAVWQNERGHEVIVQRGPSQFIPADVAILHVDLTVVPQAYLDYLKQYPVAINLAVSDISKRTISSSVIHNKADQIGPVIVKTNCNSGGLREARLLQKRGRRWQRILKRAGQKLPWYLKSELPTEDYRVFDSASQVPWPVWHNPFLVVERLQCERIDQWYCLRTWVFLGDRHTHSLSYATAPVVKQANIVRRQVLDDVPQQLKDIRARLGFDYGKFDYATVDGQVVLFDANRTPTLGNFPREQFMPRVRLLAEGLNALLPQASASQID